MEKKMKKSSHPSCFVICARAKIFKATVAVAMPVKTHAIMMTSVDRWSFMFIAAGAMLAVLGVRMPSAAGELRALYPVYPSRSCKEVGLGNERPPSLKG